MHHISVPYPPLTLEMCKAGKINRDDYYPRTVIEVLSKEGYTHMGWLNEGINPPGLNDWMQQYRNQSGSYTIMVSHGSKLIYCVDMGD
jgi:hypothetical protein